MSVQRCHLETKNVIPEKKADLAVTEIRPAKTILTGFQSHPDDVPAKELDHCRYNDQYEDQIEHESQLFVTRVVGKGHGNEESPKG